MNPIVKLLVGCYLENSLTICSIKFTLKSIASVFIDHHHHQLVCFVTRIESMNEYCWCVTINSFTNVHLMSCNHRFRTPSLGSQLLLMSIFSTLVNEDSLTDNNHTVQIRFRHQCIKAQTHTIHFIIQCKWPDK